MNGIFRNGTSASGRIFYFDVQDTVNFIILWVAGTYDSFSLQERFIVTKKDILLYYQSRPLNDEEKAYISYNASRIPRVLNAIGTLLPRIPNHGRTGAKILDVGPHFLTELIHVNFPDLVVNTLGFGDPRLYDTAIVHKHMPFDLNDAQFKEKWVPFDKHDMIVISEVIEHLYTSPVRVLSFLRTLLLPGGFILITVPNALAISKRLRMLIGRHPYEMIRESRENPGHFREYTQHELIDAGAKAGFEFVSSWLENYSPSKNMVFNALTSIVSIFPGLRQGLIVILRNPL